MAKDPAILFYTSDFLTGTMLMTDEQIGKYIKLLCLQHQKGVLYEKDMLIICKSYDKDIYDKFTREGDTFFNERLKIESEKRSKYSQSRKENRLKGITNKEKLTYDKHMENINVNKDINNKKKRKGKPKSEEERLNTVPTEFEFLEYCKTIQNINYPSLEISIKLKYKSWTENGWKDGNDKKINNWKTKILNTIPYLNGTKQSTESKLTESNKREGVTNLRKLATSILEGNETKDNP